MTELKKNKNIYIGKMTNVEPQVFEHSKTS